MEVATLRAKPQRLIRFRSVRTVRSRLFFGAGRAVAPPSRDSQASVNYNHTPFVVPTSKNNHNSTHNSVRSTRKNTSSTYHSGASPRPPQYPTKERQCEKPVSSPGLNVHAEEFVPFFCFVPPYDDEDRRLDHDPDDLDDDELLGSSRIDDIFTEEALWQHFANSDDSGQPFAPCDCHQKPRGSCPAFKKYHVDRIVRGLDQTGLVPNMDGLKEPLAFPSFPLDAWEWALQGYFDGEEILKMFRYGCDMSFTQTPTPKDARWNLQGASLYEKHVQAYVDKELEFGTLVGPFDEGDLPFQTYCSPFNTVFKKNSDIRRTVVDCSQLGLGINAFIDPHLHRGKVWKLTLPNSATIISLIQRSRTQYPGQRVLIWKLDFSRWYRWFILDPVSAIFFAVRWRGKVYIDTALSFGNRGAALAAQRVIWSVVHMFRTRVPPFPGSYNKGISCSCDDHCQCGDNLAAGYIDDFIAVSPQVLAQSQFDSALRLADTLGLRLSQTPGHVSPPSPICECLGVLYDTDRNVMQLPQDKVSDLTAILLDWSNKTRATEHELSVLCGKLLWACNVIFAGRLFLNRCLATKRFASRLENRTTILTSDFFEDIRWWQAAIQMRNGVSFLVPQSEIHVSLDASSNGWAGGKPGLGGYNHELHQYFSCTVPDELLDWTIADLELVAHVVAFHLWSSKWEHKQVTIHTDNQACYWLLTKGRSRCDIRLRMSRWLSTQQITKDFRTTSEWIPTTENNLADALSREGDPAQKRWFDDFCRFAAETPTRCHVGDECFRFQS